MHMCTHWPVDHRRGVVFVVLLSHGGIAMDKHLAKVMPRGYFDVILGGRSHAKVSYKGKW